MAFWGAFLHLRTPLCLCLTQQLDDVVGHRIKKLASFAPHLRPALPRIAHTVKFTFIHYNGSCNHLFGFIGE
ncbi:hypothetical protein GCM10009567_12840 [Rothia amarae]